MFARICNLGDAGSRRVRDVSDHESGVAEREGARRRAVVHDGLDRVWPAEVAVARAILMSEERFLGC